MIEIHGTELLRQYMSPRPKEAHKGLFGHVLVVGGGLGMPGSVQLAAHAALRVGAGRVTVATRKEYANQALPGLPEAMIVGVDSPKCLSKLLSTATVCIVGPGLGEDEWATEIFLHLVSTTLPLVVDADALRLLAKYFVEKQIHARDTWVLTPHPGEAAALLSCSTADVQASRNRIAKQMQQHYGGTIVLKGSGTLVVDADHQCAILNAGNPGMATAGMGDVLSGVIGALLAQGVATTDAAKLGVWLHAAAGDSAAQKHGERGLIASDLFSYLHQLSNPVKAT
jgi:hydroxyethylthiazole kinase-like uncharacterized protein yjeF